jgi:hypothetical protein
MTNMLLTSRATDGPCPDATTKWGWLDAPRPASFAPSSWGLAVGDAEGAVHALRPSALVADERIGREAEGLTAGCRRMDLLQPALSALSCQPSALVLAER